jgi:hypothetical protein
MAENVSSEMSESASSQGGKVIRIDSSALSRTVKLSRAGVERKKECNFDVEDMLVGK